MFDRNLMKLEGMHAILGALVLLALMQAGCIIGQAFFVSLTISQLWQGVWPADLAAPIAAFLACFCTLHLLRYGQETMLDRFSQAKAEHMRDELLHRTFDPDALLASRVGTAAIATTLIDGINELQTYLRIMPPKIIGMVAISLPVLIASFASDWVSGIILAVMFPVIIFFMILLGRQAASRAERQYAAYTRLSNRFIDTLRGLEAIKLFGASKREEASVHGYSEKLRRATVRTISTATLSSAVLNLCATFGVAAVAMMLAFRLMDGSLDLFRALYALILAPEYFAPIRAFASDFHASLDGKNTLAHVLSLLEGSSVSVAEHREDVGIPFWDESCTLLLDNVSYSYGDGRDALGPIDLKATGFERIAIVGRSGAGKSTLANLLAGLLLPEQGCVLVNGQQVDLSCEQWKTQVRYIPQHPYVFRASVADNVRLYAPQATDGEVVAAIEAVGLRQLVDELPDGLETMLGEGGRGLSGGQAHRIALARILLDEHARVLVFDEPTAHLDIETELDLKEPMLAAMDEKLVFFATHRMHWLEDMDRTVSVDDEKMHQNEEGIA